MTAIMTAMGISPKIAVPALTTSSEPGCAVSRSNQASHSSRTVVVMVAGKAILRCVRRAHADTAKQPVRTTSKPVQVIVQWPAV